MNKETIQAIKDSIEHWIADILEPLKEGKKIITGECGDLVWANRFFWQRKQELVKCKSDDCTLCKYFYLNLKDKPCEYCPLGIIGKDCSLEEGPYQKFVENPCIETAEAMIETLESLLPEESK